MSESPATLRRPLLIFTDAFEPRPVVAIYALGVVVWVAATLLIGLRPGESQLSYAVLEAFASAWQTAFGWGVATVALASLVYCLTQKKSLLAVLVNAMIFSAPFALFLLGTWSLDAFYHQHPATVETTKLFGPILMLFYVIGIAYMGWRTPGGREAALPAFMLSTATAVVLVLGLTGFKLFTSTEYIYRHAFDVLIETVDMEGQTARVQGILSINKEGSYVFSAVGNDFEVHPEEFPKPLTIEWVGKTSAPTEVGEHAFRITVPNVKPAAALNEPAGESAYDAFAYGPELYLQVSLPPSEGKSGEFLKGIPIWLREF